MSKCYTTWFNTYHDWTRWEQFTIAVYHAGLPGVRGEQRRQKRRCKECGYTQEEVVS